VNLLSLSLAHSGSLMFVTACKITREGHCGDDILPSSEWGLPSLCRRHCSQSCWPWHCISYGNGFSTLQVWFLRSERVSFLSLGSCSDQFVLFGPGGALCFGLILLDPNTFTQDWRNGQRRMENSLSHVPSWLNEVPRVLLWWETWISEYAYHMIRSTSAWVSRWVITYHASLYHQCCP